MRVLLASLFVASFVQAADPWVDFDGDSLVRKPLKDNFVTGNITGESAKALYEHLLASHKLYGTKNHIISVDERVIRGKKVALIRADNLSCGKDPSNKYTCSFHIAPDGEVTGDPDLGPAPDGE